MDDAPAANRLAPTRGEVHFEHVSFGYRPGKPILKDLTLTAKAGETVALDGAGFLTNGAVVAIKEMAKPGGDTKAAPTK